MKRTNALADRLVDGLSAGIPLRQLCRENDCSKSFVYRWFDDDEELKGRITRAREIGFEEIFENCLEIADTQQMGVIRTVKPDGAIEERQEDMLGHRKLQIETRLKLLAKWDPKRYGEKIEHEHKGAVTLQLTATDEKL